MDVAFYDKLHSLRDVLWGNNRPEFRPDNKQRPGTQSCDNPCSSMMLRHDSNVPFTPK